VADASMLSSKNLEALTKAGYTYIVTDGTLIWESQVLYGEQYARAVLIYKKGWS
jgi:hypothetical protein